MALGYRCSACIILVFITLLTKITCQGPHWGSPCEKGSSRTSHYLLNSHEKKDTCVPSLSVTESFKALTAGLKAGLAISNMECRNSRCECASMQTRIFKNNNYVCKNNHFTAGSSCNETICENGSCSDLYPSSCICNKGSVYDGTKCREAVTVDYGTNCTTPETDPIPLCDYDNLMRCNSNGTCGCYENLLYDAENKTCITQDAYVKIFPEKTKAGLDEFCGLSSDNVPKVCDKTRMSCESKKCKCIKEFYPSYPIKKGENGTCKSKASYAKENNLTSGYQVMPGVYCDTSDECIPGLTCNKNMCDCPYPCKYDNTTIACDCGVVSSMEGAAWPALLGIIGGIVIIAFWGHRINKTIEKKPKQNEHPPSIPLTNDYIPPEAISNPHYPSPAAPNPVPAPSDPSAPIGFAAPVAPSADVVHDPPPSYNDAIKDPAPFASNPAPGQTMENSTDTSSNATPSAPPVGDIYKPIIY